MKEYLVLSGMGPDRPGIAKAISEAAYKSGCSIEDSRMAVLGGEFAILVLLEGKKSSVGEFAGQLRALEKETGLTLAVRATSPHPAYHVKKGLPYRIMVVGMDRTGIVFRVTELLARHGINIESLETEARHAPVTGTPMFHMTITAEVPSEVPVRKIRKELAALCDELNMDYTLEAQT
ncbi:MAG TPA: ACT domain-containing protein [archaeon]|nr:ACT domain-containing protein [archaeon]